MERKSKYSFPGTDKSVLPIQIGAIVGAYLFVVLLIGLALLIITKRSRGHLLQYTTKRKDLELAHAQLKLRPGLTGDGQIELDHSALKRFDSIKDIPNFSYPPPALQSFRSETCVWSLQDTDLSLEGRVSNNVSPIEDDPVVKADRETMGRNLEDIYAHVMAQEDAKAQGVDVKTLPVARPGEPPLMSPRYTPRPPADGMKQQVSSPKIKKNPKQLHFEDGDQADVKPASKTATFMHALRSPIKSLRTPKTGAFPERHGELEEEPPTPRHYITGPLLPTHTNSLSHSRMTSIPSIDEALSTNSSPDDPFPPTQLGTSSNHPSVQNLRESSRENASEPTISQNHHVLKHQSSASSASRARNRMTPPMSPTTTMTSSALSPTLPGVQTLHSIPPPPPPPVSHLRPLKIPQDAPRYTSPNSATNPTGSLPFRVYESPISPTSPASSTSTMRTTTKTTVLERVSLLSPRPNTASLRTPWTAGAVPYSPYMPQTPIVPVTPRLVTRDERKSMKRSMPRTPVMEMVSDDGEVWGDGY